MRKAASACEAMFLSPTQTLSCIAFPAALLQYLSHGEEGESQTKSPPGQKPAQGRSPGHIAGKYKALTSSPSTGRHVELISGFPMARHL